MDSPLFVVCMVVVLFVALALSVFFTWRRLRRMAAFVPNLGHRIQWVGYGTLGLSFLPAFWLGAYVSTFIGYGAFFAGAHTLLSSGAVFEMALVVAGVTIVAVTIALTWSAVWLTTSILCLRCGKQLHRPRAS